VPHPKDFIGFLADVQEGDDPDDWPTYKDADRQLMLRETHSCVTLLEGFLKEVLMDSDFNANSGRIHLSEYVDKTLEAYMVLTYVNSYDVWREECLRNMPLEEEEEPQLMQGPLQRRNGRLKVETVVSIKDGPRQALTHTMHWWM
jgi:hypothetical protein